MVKAKKPKPKAKKASFLKRLETTLTTINSDTVRIGFSNIDMWVDTGSVAINRLMSGRFDRGLLFGRNYVYYGESGSGKSLQAAIACANAQKEHNAVIVWIDVEHATDDDAGKKWLARAGIDLENLIYTSAAKLQDIKEIIAEVCHDYRKVVDAGDEEEISELQPIIFVVDSWSAALPESQWDRIGGDDKSKRGKIVGDQGQKAKQTGDVILAVTHLCSGLPIMCIGMAHIMDNQDGYGRRHKTTGGNKMIYMASGCLLLTKFELKDTDDGVDESLKTHYKNLTDNMTADLKKKYAKGRTIGITCRIENLKSRVSKPFESIEVMIPWLTGMDRYSGLLDMMIAEGVVRKGTGSWYQYTDAKGEVVSFYKKDFDKHQEIVMSLAVSDISVEDTASELPIIIEDDDLPDEANEEV